MAIVTNFTYELTQSVSGSFKERDTLEFSFQAMGTANVSRYTQQKVDLFYSLNSESISWVNVANYPKTFGVGTTYATKSFSANINSDWQAVKAIITGSVFTQSGETGFSTTPRINIDYDQLQITTYTPKSELTDKGLLVFRSPSKYIKADSNGVEIKGGTFHTEKIITEELEVFGDVTIFGDFQASPIPPYAGGMTDIASGSGDNGTNANYARGDHTHELTFEVVDSLLDNKVFTNPIATTDITASATIHGNQIVGGSTRYDSAGNLVAYGANRNSIIIQTSGNASDAGIAFRNSGGSYSHNIYRTNIGSSQADLRIAGGSINSTITSLDDLVAIKGGAGATAGFVGIGNMEPSKKLTVEGDISASGNIFVNSGSAGTNEIVAPGGILGRSGSSFYQTTPIWGVSHQYPADSYGIVYEQGSPDYIELYGGGTKAHQFSLDSSNAHAHLAIPGGNVGIGTTSPESKLHLRGTSGDGWDRHLSFDIDGTVTGKIVSDNDGLKLRTMQGSDHIYFRNSANNTNLIILDGGNVGIGTTSPAVALTVEGQISASNSIFSEGQFRSSGSNNGYQVLGNRTSHPSWDGGLYRYSGQAYLSFDDNFYIKDTSDDSYIRFGINNEGRVKVHNNLQVVSHITSSGNISGSHTGSFGKLTIGTSTPDHANTQLTVYGGEGGSPIALFERTIGGTGEVAINMNSSDPQVRFFEGSDYAAIGQDATNSNLVFATGSIVKEKEAMVIDTSGNVGIGTTSPTRKLQVVESSANPAVNFTSLGDYPLVVESTDGTAGIRFKDNSAEQEFWYRGDRNIFYIENPTKLGLGTNNPSKTLSVVGDISTSGGIFIDNFQVLTGDGSDTTLSASGDIFLNTGDDVYIRNVGSNYVRFDGTNQRVGIGTSSPGYKLEVKGGRILIDGDGSNSMLSFENATGNRFSNIVNTGGDSDSTLEFQVGEATSPSTAMIIHEDGKVGIGTTSPSVILDVEESDSSTSALIDIHQSDSGTGTDTGVRFQKNGNLKGTVGYNAGTDVVSLGYGAFDNTHLSIDSSGNVGIGTTSPTRKLFVDGGSDGVVTLFTGNATNGTLVDISASGTTPNAALRFQGNNDWTIGNDDTSFVIADANNFMGSVADSLKYFVIKNDGNVGIGTTSPERLLSVSASVASHPLVTIENDNGSAGGGLQIKTADGNGTGTAFEVINYKNVSPKTIMKIPTWKTSTNIGATFPKGYVGIGTESPTHLLHITGSDEDGEMIRVQGNSSRGGTIQYNRGSSYTWRAGVGAGSSTNSNIPSSYFGIEDVSDSNTVALSIAHSTQNVGIKKTAAKAQLHIAGGGDGQAFGGKEITIDENWTTVLTIGLADHESAYVKMTINGKWDDETQHSGMMFLAEYFISNGAGSYNEPGQIIRQIDNTGGPTSSTQNTDTIRTKLVSSGDTVEIRAMLIDADGGSNDESATAKLNFHIMGEFDTIT